MPSPFVTQLDLSLANRLQNDLRSQGFELTHPQYTVFTAKKKGIACTLYESGKLVVQGREMTEFIEFYLEPEILGSFDYTHPQYDLTPRIGCDEAGKGDFFGPLCIAGVYANEQQVEKLVKLGVADSKRLNDTRISKIAGSIRKLCTHHVISLRPEKYNELYSRFRNLNSLLAWGHAAVIEQLTTRSGCRQVIVDQFASNGVLDRAVERKVDVDLVQRTQGENDLVVAAASIVARDAFVTAMDKLSQEYGMTLPKGAGPQVPVAARQFVNRHGREALAQVAKLHFKTTQEI